MGIGRICDNEGGLRNTQGQEKWTDSMLRSLNSTLSKRESLSILNKRIT